MKRALSLLALAICLLLGIAAPAAAGGDSDPTITSDDLGTGFGDGAGGERALLAGPCGSSYRHIGHHPIGSPVLAYLDVYWSSTTKRNCLITNHYGSTYGDQLYTEAAIWPTGRAEPVCPDSVGCDGGMYSYYAGPVYTPAGVDMSRRCVNIRGYIKDVGRTLTRLHCG